MTKPLLLSAIALASFGAAAASPELIPGLGLPSLAELGLTSEQLYNNGIFLAQFFFQPINYILTPFKERSSLPAQMASNSARGLLVILLNAGRVLAPPSTTSLLASTTSSALEIMLVESTAGSAIQSCLCNRELLTFSATTTPTIHPHRRHAGMLHLPYKPFLPIAMRVG
jgi:hypothetical protein